MNINASFLPLTVFLLVCPSARAAVVTTADNASPANDGQTSLLEALTKVQDNETISFNIPGAGPHYIITPTTGYPLIEHSGVILDGYTQPGSAPNTAAPDQPRNTQLKIVLDSRTEVEAARRTLLDFAGFGTSESCVLGFLNAPDARVRGLAFIGVSGQDNDLDPHVYCIALVEASGNAKIQGCWFGLDPAKTSWAPDSEGVVPGVYGARSAVASFRGDSGDSAGLTFGTDGDGQGDRGEGNVCVAQRLAVHLQTQQATVAGNWINLFPDGSILNPEAQALVLEDGSLEVMENGDGIDMRVGTNGDGISDAEEGNRFGPVVYDVFAEFWRPAQNVIFAGNSVGMGLNAAPAFESLSTSLLSLRENSTIRIGTDGNGTSDAAEANHFSGIGGAFLKLKAGARIHFRGNQLSANMGRIPNSEFSGVLDQTLFSDILNDPDAGTVVILNPASTPTAVSGTFPKQFDGITPPVIDLYLADSRGLQPDFLSPQGRVWLGSFKADAAGDLDPATGQFQFDTTSLNLTATELGYLTATATYELVDVGSTTTNFSGTLITPPQASPLGPLTISGGASSLTLEWSGGLAPFQVRSSASPAGPWSRLRIESGQTTTITPDTVANPRQFYQIQEGAPHR